MKNRPASDAEKIEEGCEQICKITGARGRLDLKKIEQIVVHLSDIVESLPSVSSATGRNAIYRLYHLLDRSELHYMSETLIQIFTGLTIVALKEETPVDSIRWRGFAGAVQRVSARVHAGNYASETEVTAGALLQLVRAAAPARPAAEDNTASRRSGFQAKWHRDHSR